MLTSFEKIREIQFTQPHEDSNQAQTAMLLLTGICGISHCTLLNANRLLIHYDIKEITLEIIETALREIGFHLDNNLLQKLKRALHYYTEETQRLNLGITRGTKDFTGAITEQYDRRKHGCRDTRAEHWREYL